MRRLDTSVVVVFLLTVYGFVLRIWDLGSQSLWHDAGYSVNAALSMLERGLPILPSGHLYARALLNTGLIAASMGLFGETEFAARLPSVLFGTLTIPVVYLFVKRVGDKRLALITAFLVTFSVLEIAWSREARMYQQLQFFYILSLYAFYEFAQGRKNRYLVLTFVSTVCAVLSHALGFSLVLVYFAYVVLANVRSTRKLTSREFLFNRQMLIFALGAVGVLTLAVALLIEYSDIWGVQTHYVAVYWRQLEESFPVILLI